MDQICLAIPVLPSRADDARDFMRELDDDRMADYASSEQRIGIDKEVWFLASGPQDLSLIAYIEAADFASALEHFSASRDDFDMWFKRRLDDVTGLDLNNPPAMTLPELLSAYSSANATATA
jgi:hypothetical protein